MRASLEHLQGKEDKGEEKEELELAESDLWFAAGRKARGGRGLKEMVRRRLPLELTALPGPSVEDEEEKEKEQEEEECDFVFGASVTDVARTLSSWNSGHLSSSPSFLAVTGSVLVCLSGFFVFQRNAWLCGHMFLRQSSVAFRRPFTPLYVHVGPGHYLCVPLDTGSWRQRYLNVPRVST